jgi:serine phosphatase RsbU (regulator of sigma subunit)
MERSNPEIMNTILSQFFTSETFRNVNLSLSQAMPATGELENSIKCAQLIQRSVFPKISMLENKFNDLLVLYRPKSVIGGDFYWVEKIHDRYISICADCTGHGVPGALLSMVGYQFILQIILEKRIFNPAEILNLLHAKMTNLISEEAGVKSHGMDISVCVYKPREQQLEFAGARSLIFIENGGDLVRFKGDCVSIGDRSKAGFTFTNTQINVEQDTWLFQFSDGMYDQFGGPNGKKMGRKRFKTMLKSNVLDASTLYKENLVQAISEWKRGFRQTDDMTLIGKRLSF